MRALFLLTLLFWHGSARADLIEQCLAAPASQTLSLTVDNALIALRSQSGKRTLVVGGDRVPLPPRSQAPIVRYNSALGGALILQDMQGDERYRLRFDPLTSAGARQLSPQGARVAAPLVDPANRSVIFSSTAGQGPIWGVLAHDLEAAGPRVVFQEGGAWQPMATSADGRRLVLQQVFGLYDRVIYILDQKTSIKTPLYFGQRPVAIRAAAISPDGQRVYVATALVRGGGRILVADVHAGSATVLHRADWPLYDIKLSGDGSRLFALENRDGVSWLVAFDMQGQGVAPKEIPLEAWATDLAVSADGQVAALTLSQLGQPPRSVLLKEDTGFAPPTPANRPSACGPISVARADITRSKPVGGLETLPVKVLRPANLSGPFPVVLAFHGGPEGQWVETSQLNYTALANTLGAAIVMPNLVGSTGYGLLYSAADDGAARTAVPGDVSLVLDYIAGDPTLDETRIVAMGASYGGYLAMLSLAQNPDRIQAAISQVGISHIPSFLSETPLTRRGLRRNEYGDEREDKIMKVLDALSPLTLAQAIKGPILLIHGRNDARVLVGQATRMKARLDALGKEVRYLELPESGHVLRDYETQLRVLREKAAFLEKQFGP
ncbi:MAG: prolyl oligopeptidase family serine peptidase [Pseudomonadota bacterium]